MADSMLEKYPWLRLRTFYTDAIDEDYNALNDIPKGWVNAFGDLLCEELDEAIKKAGIEDKFVIFQVKEKYGRLRIHVSPETIEIADILDKYSAISKHVCSYCGKPDTPVMRIGTWFLPCCKECYSEFLPFADEAYNKIADSGDKNKIHNSITVIRSVGDNEYKKRKIDVKDTADKIRARWSEWVNGRS